MNDIKLLRQKKGLTQIELANAMKTSQSTISLWESGVYYPRLEKLITLAKILDCSVEDLIKGMKKGA